MVQVRRTSLADQAADVLLERMDQGEWRRLGRSCRVKRPWLPSLALDAPPSVKQSGQLLDAES